MLNTADTASIIGMLGSVYRSTEGEGEASIVHRHAGLGSQDYREGGGRLGLHST